MSKLPILKRNVTTAFHNLMRSHWDIYQASLFCDNKEKISILCIIKESTNQYFCVNDRRTDRWSYRQTDRWTNVTVKRVTFYRTVRRATLPYVNEIQMLSKFSPKPLYCIHRSFQNIQSKKVKTNDSVGQTSIDKFRVTANSILRKQNIIVESVNLIFP